MRAPPPTRGWTLHWQRLELRRDGSPAYAGMDPPRRSFQPSPAGLPRLRGDGPPTEPMKIAARQAPPPTRGWTPEVSRVMARLEGSPAYAGMDPRPAFQRCSTGRLPRLRGDGPLRGSMCQCRLEAPPPTRGWTHSWPVCPRDD